MDRHKRPRAEAALVTPDPEVYTLGLLKQVMALSDAVLLVQSHELPVHSFILAANSPVLADLFETAFTAESDDLTFGRAAGSRPKPGGDKTMIQLERDSEMCIALRYCYVGCNMSSPDKPKLHNCKDAAGLVRIAHKYNMQALHCEAEKYLIAKASNDSGKNMFEDPCSFQLVEWVVQAESCKLDEFAHAELYMIKHTEVAFWHEIMDKNRISTSSFTRVLRSGMHFRQKVDKLLQDQLANAATVSNVSLRSYTSGRLYQDVVQEITTGVQNSNVTAEMLMQWHKEGAVWTV
ncbi:hypothetical protein WJX77_012249 [Trebouxia sp. C0004]